MVGTGGIEPPTSCVSSKRSTTELRAYFLNFTFYIAKVKEKLSLKNKKNCKVEPFLMTNDQFPYAGSGYKPEPARE